MLDAFDVQASTINMAMKIAAAEALAELARTDVPDEVAASFHGNRPRYGPGYIIPAPFDPRLIRDVPSAVAKAAIDSGVARQFFELIWKDAVQRVICEVACGPIRPRCSLWDAPGVVPCAHIAEKWPLAVLCSSWKCSCSFLG